MNETVNITMKKLTVATSSLTGTIFAGTPLKSGLWGSDKEDVTIDCLVAVAEHALRFGKPVIISTHDGTPLYKITVEKLDG